MAAGFRALLKWLNEALDPLYPAVRQAAQMHLTDFGYKGVHIDYSGIQSSVELQHCKVSFSVYKNDFECWMKPISVDGSFEYEAQLIYETPLGVLSGVRHHVYRCVSIIVENCKPVLKGDFEGWPKVERD